MRPDMTPQEVQRRWHVRVHAPEVELGSDSVVYAAICQGATSGWARFWGPNGGPFGLTEVHFTAGARTDVGIAIGSPRSKVIAVYGARAFHPKLGGGVRADDLMVVGRGSAIVFGFRNDTVDQIVFGRRDAIREPVAANAWRYEIPALPHC